MKKNVVVARAYVRYLRISPRKARLVIDLIRGLSPSSALAILANVNKRARLPVEKVLRSAISNAQQNHHLNLNELFISKITCDGGPMLKRFRAAAMGRATMIRHRTAHITVELSSSVAEVIKKSNQKPVTRNQIKKEKTKKLTRRSS